ncbi:FAD binding domain-containing protein [Neofusicoccum parvum]|uniref:FAD binding domain-containing protein n=1 Tax=Neofusicoccum parvum TaxID=310453 RepID=A0ACB5SLL3_9PEZI|nr:FAD binding domain-containing protein [Neofusicoccum parvum]
MLPVPPMSDQRAYVEHVGTVGMRDETLPIPGAPRTEFDFPDTFDHSQIPLEKEEWPVIVIGSSMVGMSLQLMLGFHGVKSLSFDRHPSTATRTRAALFLLRSIEIFRQLSLEPALRAASATNFDLDSGMLLTTALAGGTVLGAVQESDAARTAHATPCARLWLTQDMYEPWVQERAGALGAQQRFGERVVWYAEDADGVLVVVQDGATRRCWKYRAAYLVACDGGRSPTRRRERVEWRGPGVLGSNISIYFRADLTALLGSRAKYGVTYVVNPRIRAIWRLGDSGKAGFLVVMGVEGRDGFEPDSVSEREAREMFALALGRSVEGLDMEIEEISYYTSAAYNSDCFASKQGKGRVFLAGDAAHVMPPTGGMGGNTGIQDAYNLAWKLALVVNGKASHGLLASYNSERQRVAGFTVQQAYRRFVNRVLKDPKLGHMKEFPDDTVELGYRYPAPDCRMFHFYL